MKDEIAQLLKSLNETIKAFVKVGEKVLLDFGDVFKNEETASREEKSEQSASEAVKPAKKATPKKQTAKPVPKAAPKKAGKGKRAASEGEGSIIGKVQTAIENSPGIDFKTLQEKTVLEVKQIRNTLAALKKQGKIRSDGKGVYFPSDQSDQVKNQEMKEEGPA